MSNKKTSQITPESLTGRALQKVANTFIFRSVTGSDSVVASDVFKALEVNSASDCTITVDGGAISITDFPVGGAVQIIWYGTGQPTIAGADGTTILSDGADSKIPSQYKPVVLVRRSLSEFYLFGIGQGTTSSVSQLSAPAVTFGAVTSSSVVVNWTSVTGATTYVVKRNTSNTITGATTIYTGALLTFSDTGLSASTTYYYFVVAQGTGYSDSTAGTGSQATSAAGNITPAAPTAGTVEDTLDTFDFTYTPGYTTVSEYEYTLDGGTTTAALTAKPLSVGNIAKSADQVGVRVKAATGRNASAWLFNAQPFTVASTATSLLDVTFETTSDLSNNFDILSSTTPGASIAADGGVNKVFIDNQGTSYAFIKPKTPIAFTAGDQIRITLYGAHNITTTSPGCVTLGDPTGAEGAFSTKTVTDGTCVLTFDTTGITAGQKNLMINGYNPNSGSYVQFYIRRILVEKI